MSDTVENSTYVNKVQIIDDDQNTQLHYSAAAGDLEKVTKDLDTHPKIDVENFLGWTPLMMACRNGHVAVVNLLLEKRADCTKRNHFGMNVFGLCVASKNLEMAKQMLQHLLCGGVSKLSLEKVFSPISLSILFSNPEMTNFLVKQNFNINHQLSVTHITPSMFASALEKPEMLTLLTKHGANEGMQSSNGQTSKDITEAVRKSKYEPVVKEIPKIVTNPPPPQQVPMPSPVYHPPPQQFHHPYPQQCRSSIPVIMYPNNGYYNAAGNPGVAALRRSSNTISPNYLPPNITPIPPMPPMPSMSPMAYSMPQVFFPPDFSPNGYGAHMNYSYIGNDFLNDRIYSPAYYAPTDMSDMSPMC